MTSAFHALWLRGLRAPVSWRYAVGILAAIAPSLLRIEMNAYWGARFPYVLYFPATLFTALFAGLGPALVGIGIFAVLTWVWVLPPVGSLAISNLIDVVGLAIFILSDGIIACIGASHRHLIQQSERQRAELAVRREEAEASNRAKDDFLAVVSHELRTPLTTIVAGVRVLHHIGSPEARAASIRDAMERQALQLTRIVDDLLDVKRIVTGPVVLERRPCDLAQVVTDFIATWTGSGRFKEHSLVVDAEPVWVNADTARLQQIIDNLVSNALKYTPAGGSISVSVSPEAEDAVLRVRDSGIGISPDLVPRLFELFVQGESGSARSRSGLGIGLAVVRRLVELHGGSVQVFSEGPARGSTFTVRLPRAPAPSE